MEQERDTIRDTIDNIELPEQQGREELWHSMRTVYGLSKKDTYSYFFMKFSGALVGLMACVAIVLSVYPGSVQELGSKQQSIQSEGLTDTSLESLDRATTLTPGSSADDGLPSGSDNVGHGISPMMPGASMNNTAPMPPGWESDSIGMGMDTLYDAEDMDSYDSMEESTKSDNEENDNGHSGGGAFNYAAPDMLETYDTAVDFDMAQDPRTFSKSTSQQSAKYNVFELIGMFIRDVLSNIFSLK